MSERPPAKSMPDQRQPEDVPVIRALHMVDSLFGRVYHHVEILTPCTVPKTGPAIVVCNHIGSLDPMLVQAATAKRIITWMMAAEYMDLPGLGWFFRKIGVIPVERSGKDSGPLRAALRALENGRVLGIFPEGRFSKTGEFLPFQTGVGMIAGKTGAPVVPVYQTGSHRNRDMLAGCLIPAQARLAFGKAFVIPKSDGKRPDPGVTTSFVENRMAFLKKKVDKLHITRHY